MSFDKYVYRAAEVAHPRKDNSSCVAGVVYSTVHLEWITVPCDREFEQSLILCEHKELYDSRFQKIGTEEGIQEIASIRLSKNRLECLYGWVQIESVCYRMIDVSAPTGTSICLDLRSICHTMGARLSIMQYPEHEKSQALLLYIKLWLDDPRKDSFYVVEDKTRRCMTKSFLEPEPPMMTLSDMESAQASYMLCERGLSIADTSCLENQYSCADGTCILIHHHCDGTPDCPDSSDETFCENVCVFREGRTSQGQTQQFPETPGRECFENCFPDVCDCSDLYFHCQQTGRCLPASKLCDGIYDCKHEEDETFCKRSYTIATAAMYTPKATPGWYCQSNYTRCSKEDFLESRSCFPRHKVCLFERQHDSHALKYCQNGEHLQFCTEHQCLSDFKCAQSYCIPYHYVCNGRADCPHGEDEQNCTESCPGLLRCKKDNVCVHPYYVGDDVVDCSLSQDDEILQHSGGCLQVKECSCLGGAVSCPSSHFHALPKEACKFKVILLFNNTIHNLSVSSGSFRHLLILDLSKNKVVSVALLQLGNFQLLVNVNLDHNAIVTLGRNDFPLMQNLAFLSLKNNSITTIGPGSFNGLLALEILDLSENPLQVIAPSAFHDILGSLQHFYYRNNTVTENLIASLRRFSNLCVIYIDLARLCPYLPGYIQCNFTLRNYISCCKLINNKVVGTLLWILAVVGVGLNAASVIFLLQSGHPITTQLLCILSHVSDFMLCFYYVSLGILNIYYRDMFLFHHEEVSRGLFCQTLASLAFMADGMSQFAGVLNCIQRMCIIVWPLNDPRSQLKWYTILAIIFLLLLILSLVVRKFMGVTNAVIDIPCFLVPVTTTAPRDIYMLVIYLLNHCVPCIISLVAIGLAMRKLGDSGILQSSRAGKSKVKESAYRRSSIIVILTVWSFLSVCVIQTFLLYRNIAIDSTTMVTVGLVLLARSLIIPVLFTLSTQNFIKWVLFSFKLNKINDRR